VAIKVKEVLERVSKEDFNSTVQKRERQKLPVRRKANTEDVVREL
jgi:hypothetical protein